MNRLFPVVLNRKKTNEEGIYIGRGSKWGNPYKIGIDGTREEVIEKYKEYYRKNDNLQKSIHELRGHNLICWCAPFACHGDFLLEEANGNK